MKSIAIIIPILAIILFSCSSAEEQKMASALSLANENRPELEKVLKHFQKDEQKLHAAHFIIANMPGHYGVTNETINKMQLVYNKHQRISEKYNWLKNTDWGHEIDSLKDASLYLRPQYTKDIHNLTSNWLIKHIDLSFDIWKNNSFTSNFPFPLFCSYILPYRLTNGINIDSYRENIYNRHKNLVQTNYTISIENAIDSLLYLYQDISYNQMYGASIPIYTFSTLEQIKSSKCSDRCWFNELLFNSLGFPVSTDFIPNWGNRNNSHSWNVLITPDSIYPFAALWEKEKTDRWKYKELYKNEKSDLMWGKFRLSKVYRNTYSLQHSSPLMDETCNINDVPLFFRNPWMQDVSEQYFDTCNIHITIPKSVPKNVQYSYLCTYDYQQWTPVQWGEINNRQVTFSGMGRDILYLPIYYQFGETNYLNSPFWLSKDGKIQTLQKRSGMDTLFIRRTEGVWLSNEIIKSRTFIENLTILGLNSISGKYDTLHIVDNIPEIEMNIYNCKNGIYKKIRLITESDTLAFNEISFNSYQNRIPAHVATHSGEILENYGFDHHSETAFMSIRKNKKKHIIDLELEKEAKLTSISIYPYTQNSLNSAINYELFYWENGWTLIGTKKGNTTFLQWENVPKGCLFLLKNTNRKANSGERPFIYENGDVIWL